LDLLNVDTGNFVSFSDLVNASPTIFETGNVDTCFCY